MVKQYKEKLFLLFEKMRKDKKTFLIILIGFAGILLIFFSELTEKDVGDLSTVRTEDSCMAEGECEKLEQIISKISGVGKVKVMITYEGTSESLYACDASEQIKGEERKKDEEYIILDKGNTEDGLLRKEIFPKVIGVAVVCQGGSKAVVRNEITQMLKALYNINSNNISISEMNI